MEIVAWVRHNRARSKSGKHEPYAHVALRCLGGKYIMILLAVLLDARTIPAQQLGDDLRTLPLPSSPPSPSWHTLSSEADTVPSPVTTFHENPRRNMTTTTTPHSDDAKLARLGYKQEFRRHFTPLEVFGISFSIIGIFPSIA